MTKIAKTEAKLREAPTIFKDEDNKLQVTVTYDDMIKNLFGMKTRAAANGILITGLGSLGKRGDAYYDMLTNMAVEMEPKDAVEAMLVTQMTATNAAFSYALQQMVDSPHLPRVEAFDRIANKLARTFTIQVEALKKYRAKAQQIVRVERVDVREGGQAIVGDVTHQAGGARMKGDINPLHPTQRLQNAPRCTAKSKRTGLPCRSPAVRGWRVCRMHGAGGGQKAGTDHSQYQHGGYSRDALEMRKLVTALTRNARGNSGGMDS